MKLNQINENYYYHVTPVKNIPSIMKTGLQPRIGDRSKMLELKKAIYLFRSKNEAEDAVGGWLGDQFDDNIKLALLQIELPEEATRKDVSFETQVFTPISPEQITVINKNI